MRNIKQKIVAECNAAEERYNSIVEILREPRLTKEDAEALKDILYITYHCKVDINSILRVWSNGKYGLEPETIVLKNGLEIPKPLTQEQVCKFPCDVKVYSIWSLGDFYIEKNPLDCCHYMNDKSLIYATKEEAIEASKILFTLED